MSSLAPKPKSTSKPGPKTIPSKNNGGTSKDIISTTLKKQVTMPSKQKIKPKSKSAQRAIAKSNSRNGRKVTVQSFTSDARPKAKPARKVPNK